MMRLIKRVVLALTIFLVASPELALATSIVCNKKITNTDFSAIGEVLTIYESAYKQAGFQITKKESSQDKAEFRAAFVVPSSVFESEVPLHFYHGFDGIYMDCIRSIEPIKWPEKYDRVEQGRYLSLVSEADDNARKEVENQLKIKFGE